MADNETLRLQLEQARHQLHTAHTRVASLEALLTETVLPSASIAHNENNYGILDHLIEGCQIISFDWRYLYLNDSAAFHGRQSKEELLGRTMMECYPGIENTPFFITLRRSMENRSPQSLENEFVYPNGMKKWFELTIQPVPEGVFILSLDITERKRAESQLSEREEWIRLSLEATELGKWRHNILTGIVRFDERARVHYGLDRDTLPIEEFLGHIHPADIDGLLQEISATIAPSSDGKYTTEYRVVHADGSVHWLAVQARVYFEGEGDARHPVHGFGTTQNITERKRSELALKRHTKSVEELSQFLNTTLDAFPANTAVLASDGTIIKVNAAWERFADDNDMLVETAYLGDNYLTICDKSVGALSQESIPAAAGIREVIDGRRDDFYLEYPCHSPSQKRWFIMRVTPFAEPVPRRVVVAHINTTERKLGELALRESEQRFQRMADSAPAMLWTTDETGAVTFTSRGWYEYTGLDEEIGLGFDWLNAVHPEDFAKTDAMFAAAIKQPQDYELDYRLRRADGEYRWVVDCGRPLFAADGKFTGYVGSIIDNHERKLAQQELEALYNATSHLFTTDSLANLGQQIVETVVSEFQHADCGLMLVDKAQNRMVRFGRAGNYDLRPDAALTLDGPGLVPLAARTGSAVYAPDVRNHPGYVASEARTRSELAVPLITARGVIAVLDLQRIEIDGFSERDQRVLTAYAERAAAALENMQLYEALEQRVVERTAELKAAKDRVEAILNNSVDGILLVYPDLRIQQANSAFNWLFACETDDYFNKSLLDLVHADDVQRVQAIIAAGSSDGVDRRLEIRAVRSDGKVFDAEFSIGHVKTDGFVCTVRDITERKEQERQLRYHASLQQNISDAVIATDMEFRIQSWNSAAESMYGWRADEVIGRGVVEVFKTQFESDAERERITEAFLKQGYWQGEFIQKRKDGSEIYVMGSTNLLKDESGAAFGILSINHDVTERKRVENVIRESESRYRLLAENITDVVMRINQAGDYLYLSPSSRSVLGYEPDELIGHSSLHYVHPDDLLAVEHTMKEMQDPNVSRITVVVRFLHKHGHYVWLESVGQMIRSVETGEVEGFISSSRDISDRKRAEEALRESEERFRLLVNAAPVAIVICDKTGNITLVNNQAEQLFGYNRAELAGRPVEMLVPDNRRKHHVRNRSGYMANPSVRPMGIGLELFARRKDGSDFPVEIELSYIERNDDIMVMSFILDITERKRIAAELERQRTFLKEVIDVTPSMIFVKDYDSRFVLVNPMVAKIYNTTVESLIGKSDSDLNPSFEEVDRFLEADRRVIASGESFFLEEPVTSSTGETRWFQTTKVPISPDGISKYVLGVSTDITERRNAEAALRQALEKEHELGELKSRFVSMASHEFRTPLATILALTETLSAYRHKLPEDQIENKFDKIKEQVEHLRAIMEDVLLLARMQARRVEFKPMLLDFDALCRSVLDEFQSRLEEFKHQLVYTLATGHQTKVRNGNGRDRIEEG